MLPSTTARRIAVVVKGYPRLSETFIAQEILALEAARPRPRDLVPAPSDRAGRASHAQGDQGARSPTCRNTSTRSRCACCAARSGACGRRASGRTIKAFWRDLRRDFTANRVRRLGQAFVMARELPAEVRHLHVHYLHTPASVVRYAALLTGRTWTFSAHAKDIWTTPDWEKREKMAEALWGVTCTAQGAAHLQSLVPARAGVARLSRARSVPVSRRRPKAARRGTAPTRSIRSASSPSAAPWRRRASATCSRRSPPCRRTCTGASPMWAAANCSTASRSRRRTRASPTGCAFLGSKAQPDIIALLREADLFVLPSKEAKSGDRDGLPNVIMEAASQKLAIVATDFAGIPEFIRDGVEGELVPPGDWEALSNALNLLARDPERREALGAAAFERLRRDFSMEGGIDVLEARFRVPDGRPQARTGAGVTIARPVAFYAPLKSPNHPLPVGRPHHGAPADEGSRPGGLCAAARQRVAHARQGGRSGSVRSISGSNRWQEASRLIAHYQALPEEQPPLPLVHLSRLLQGAGLDRPARRRRPRHSLCRRGRIAGREARAAGPGLSAIEGAEAALDRADAIFVMTAHDREALEAARPPRQSSGRPAALSRPAGMAGIGAPAHRSTPNRAFSRWR